MVRTGRSKDSNGDLYCTTDPSKYRDSSSNTPFADYVKTSINVGTTCKYELINKITPDSLFPYMFRPAFSGALNSYIGASYNTGRANAAADPMSYGMGRGGFFAEHYSTSNPQGSVASAAARLIWLPQ